MQSIVSYPDRGVGGNAKYRGNCSPHIIEDLIDQFGWIELSDYMCGSGTTEDVCKQRGIKSHCYDLNRGFDLMSMDIPERNNAIFWHPPYGDMIQYSDNMYSSKEIQAQYGINPAEADLSRIHDWSEFVKAMNYCCMKQFASLEPGGRLCVLMGDMKKKGKLYSMLCDIIKPGTIENIVIKAQHNCMSYSNFYSGKFIPIVHEYLLILRKDNGLLYPIAYTKHQCMDLRDSKNGAWKDIVAEVMQGHGKMALDDIYKSIEGHKRCEGVNDWKAKIRQTLQVYPFFHNYERGVWEYQAA